MIVQRLADVNLSAGAAAPMNVCVVSSEFGGPVKNGGIGTATTGLIKQLVADGHKVTLLYTLVEYGQPFTGDKPWKHWVDSLKAEGVTLAFIPHHADYRAWREKSWRVKEFVGQNEFDLVYFNDHQGNGYYSLLGKRTGLAPFSEQLHCVITHGSMEWVFDINDQYAGGVRDLEMMGLERRSVEMADVVIGPSVYLLNKYESYGWRLPERTYSIPYPLFREVAVPSDVGSRRIDEVVFFGRLETRKGLWLFCEALDRLSERLAGKTVTFLGKKTVVSGLSTGLQVINRSANWPCRVKLLTDFNRNEALSYLRESRKLAVIPSLADNSPCVVYECMEAGIPFLTTRGSGADELVDPKCWDDVLVRPSVEALAEKLADVFQHGAQLGRPRFDPKDNLAVWSRWHRYVARNRAELIATSDGAAVTTPAAVSENPAIPLIVMLDDGHCKLSLLLENLSSHLKRFANRAGFLLLSSRQGELQGALLHIFEDFEGALTAPICILDARTVEEARYLIFSSAIVFFIDAEIEIQTSFFALAVNALTDAQPAIVTCVVAARAAKNEPAEIEGPAEIEDLPSGDVPGLSALGYPIGGAAWAMTASRLAEELSPLEFYDAQTDAFKSSGAFGQLVMQRCRRANVPISVFPIVGAVEMRQRSNPRRVAFNDARMSAAALGVAQSLHQGGAAWLAISAFGAHQQGTIEHDLAGMSPLLADDHPLRSLATNEARADLPVLAAALGRMELSLQLEASKGAAPARVRSLMETAKRSARLRPSTDLLEALRQDEIFEFGREPLPQLTASGRSRADDRASVRRAPSEGDGAASRGGPAEAARIYVDGRRLRVQQNRIRAAVNLPAESPGKLFFFDVPLLGNTSLNMKLRCGGSCAASIRVTCVDQQNGEQMGTASTTLMPKEDFELSIPLHGIFGRAAILCEFGGKDRMELCVEEMHIA